MKIIEKKLNGLIVISPYVFKDNRGYFFESYNYSKLKNIFKKSTNRSFLQSNISYSKKNVLRGLHMQSKPHEQGKLVSVLRGKVFDVAVDLRPNSKFFGKFHYEILSDINKKIIWIPEGFAHGFLTLSKEALLEYKVTDTYFKNSEITIKWNDSKINIPWPIKKPIISDKDKIGLSMDDFKKYIKISTK